MKKRGRPRLSPGKKILFALFTLALIFGGMEGLLRICGFEYASVPKYLSFHQDRYMFAEGARTFERDPNLFWRLVPNQKELGINPQGFRGTPFTTIKKPGVKRILCLGCSVTFGLHEPKAYASYLEERLNQPGAEKAFEVYNMGVPGYSSFQGLRLLETKALDYNPDLITVFFGWNDHWLMKSLPDREQKPPSTLAKTLDRSRLYQFLFYLYMEFRAKNIQSTFSPDDLRVSQMDYSINLKKIIDITREEDIDIVLVTAPTSIRDKNDIPGFLIRDDLILEGMDLPALHESYNWMVRTLSEHRKLPLADCAKALEPDVQALMMKDGIHPNEEGHKRIAEVIYRTIQEAYPDFLADKKNTSREEK
jgi:lysophospholipase L1-like esterase